MYNPEHYTISVRLEEWEDELLYVGRVEELPDVMEFADSAEEARNLVLDTIRVAMEVYQQQNRPFPAPKELNADKYSGRITLRIPKTLHRNLSQLADKDNVSLNTLLVSLLASGVAVNGEKLRVQI
ncbi:hypothetical protein A1D22_10540 [Pasteurellaceae bacterium LFhippo2]|nr:hypothetical protein [Pasteurellaceae bacterium LFhippo2]